MARSSNIYVVHEREFGLGPLRAAFTVKHELISWLEQNQKYAGRWNVYRLRDGWPESVPVLLGRGDQLDSLRKVAR